MKVIVVCDANGECKGVVTDPALADRMADYFGAYVSEHEVDKLSPSVVTALPQATPFQGSPR